MKINHNYFLNLAFQLAEKNLGQTGLNPSVGSVVVKNKSVVPARGRLQSGLVWMCSCSRFFRGTIH